MPFVPQGKKARLKADRARRHVPSDATVRPYDMEAEEAREEVIAGVVGGVRVAIPQPRLCLPTCVLVQRALKLVLPHARFALRLGSLHVCKESGADPIVFDPRGPDGIDGGFHAWLEDERSRVVDPSILLTLRSEGYNVDPDSYVTCGGRKFRFEGLVYEYEEVTDLMLVGEKKSEPALAELMALAMIGKPPSRRPDVKLDVDWRAGRRPTPRATVTPEG